MSESEAPLPTIDPELAARLTLLLLRASVPARVPLRDDVVAFGRAATPVSTDEAIRRLVAAPKPFACWPELEGDVLVIQSRIPARMGWTFGLQGRDVQDNEEIWRGELGDDFLERSLLCIGRNHESLVVSFREREAWRREYGVGGVWGGGGCAISRVETEDADSVWYAPRAVVDEARARGAVYAWHVGQWRDDDSAKVHVAITRIEPGPRAGPDCERCREREARYALEWLEDERPPRRWCQRCVDEEVGVSGFNEGRDLEKLRTALWIDALAGTPAELAATADELAFQWTMKKPPPFVREFIARYRAPDS